MHVNIFGLSVLYSASCVHTNVWTCQKEAFYEEAINCGMWSCGWRLYCCVHHVQARPLHGCHARIWSSYTAACADLGPRCASRGRGRRCIGLADTSRGLGVEPQEPLVHIRLPRLQNALRELGLVHSVRPHLQRHVRIRVAFTLAAVDAGSGAKCHGCHPVILG